MTQFIRRSRPTEFIKVSTLEEMMQCMEISKALFGSERGDIQKHMNILKKNPETYYMIKDEDQAIGYTAIWPVKNEELNKLVAQTIPVKISAENIETFEVGKKVDIYVNVIGIKPSSSREEKRIYGARLIAGLLDVIVKMGERGIPIGTVAARSNMPEGIRLMKGIGFTEVEPLTPERRTFIINVKESGIPFILQYKRALQEANERP